MKPIHIVCVKWGTKYGPEYVNRLHAAVTRNTTIHFKFHCFTDDTTGLAPRIITHELKYRNLDTWWNKLYLFSDEIDIPSGEKIFYIDLDTLITGNIDELLKYQTSKLVALKDFYHGIAKSAGVLGSGLMLWHHRAYTKVWTEFIRDPVSAVNMMSPHGDQKWIEYMVPETRRAYWQDLFPDNVVSFKMHCGSGLPALAKIVCYHGKPSIPESATQHTKDWRFDFPAQPWVLNYWRDRYQCVTRHVRIPARQIFGMVGRSGGGYNTVWSDWSDKGRLNRDSIVSKYETEMNRICGHYAKLESSIMSEGMRNPLIVTCGFPTKRKLEHLPPEMRSLDPRELLLLEGTTGGSRLWVAQKHDLEVDCIVNDWTGRFNDYPLINTVESARALYKDPPATLTFDHSHGLVEIFDKNKVAYHLGTDWSEDKLLEQRAVMWITLMNNHGYTVERLPMLVNDILKRNGIDQKQVTLAKKIDVSDSGFQEVVVLISGTFDWLTVRHLDYIKKSRAMGDRLIVALRSDTPASMPFEERRKVLESLRQVDEVVTYEGVDGLPTETIKKIKRRFKKSHLVVSVNENTVDADLEENIAYVFGVGVPLGESK